MTNEPTTSATTANAIRNMSRNWNDLPAACSASFAAAVPVSTSTSRSGTARRSAAASSACDTPGAATTSIAV